MLRYTDSMGITPHLYDKGNRKIIQFLVCIQIHMNIEGWVEERVPTTQEIRRWEAHTGNIFAGWLQEYPVLWETASAVLGDYGPDDRYSLNGTEDVFLKRYHIEKS